MLLIDNYDSFAHNLARYFSRLGQTVRVARNDAIDLKQLQAAPPRAIVISPGPATPNEAGHCLQVVRQMHQSVPILGVCLGHQVIAQAMGGHIVRAATPIHGRSSLIHHQGKGVFAGLPSPMRVGRYHSLIVEPETLPADFETLAATKEGVMMAFQHRTLPIVGLQFHPESVLTEHGYTILAAFLKLARLPTPKNPAKLCTDEFPASSTATRTDARSDVPCVPPYPITF